MKSIQSIALCASASFYKEALEIENALKKLGFNVTIPYTARLMKKTGDFNVASYTTWFTNPKDYKKKALLIQKHFKKITKNDAIFVINLKKNDQEGYIGGNVLMEMGIAFYLKKPIFIYNDVPNDSPFYEEIMGMGSHFIKNDLSKI